MKVRKNGEKEMTSRERVLKAIKFDRPDRIPIMHAALPAAFYTHGQALVDLLNKKYPHDFGPPVHTIPPKENLPPEYRAGEHFDSWGTLWRNEEEGMHGQVAGVPLDDWSNLKTFKLPPLPSEEDVLKNKEDVKKHKENYFYLTGPYGLGNLFERLQFLRGYENLMLDFIQKPEEIYELMDMLLDYMVEGTRLVLLLEPDCVAYADDWGTQLQLIINPREWRHFFKPRYKKLFDIVHAAGAYTYFHSDGMIMEIIPDFIEIGLDILNPQFSCMDLEKLASLTKKKLVISSDIDRQYILPFGTPEEVRKYVRKVIDIFDAKNGGFIGRGEIAKDVPIENAEAMYRAFLEE